MLNLTGRLSGFSYTLRQPPLAAKENFRSSMPPARKSGKWFSHVSKIPGLARYRRQPRPRWRDPSNSLRREDSFRSPSGSPQLPRKDLGQQSSTAGSGPGGPRRPRCPEPGQRPFPSFQVVATLSDGLPAKAHPPGQQSVSPLPEQPAVVFVASGSLQVEFPRCGNLLRALPRAQEQIRNSRRLAEKRTFG